MNPPQRRTNRPEGLTQQPRALTKRVFMQEYILARATAVDGAMSGDGAAVEARKAWDIIDKECK